MENGYVGSFKFHPVGHGLFYSGIFKNSKNDSPVFSFVYDCGGKSTKIVHEAIDKSGLPKTINLLIISHFHADHIRGVFFFFLNHKIEKVILPYLYETLRIVYLASLQKETKDIDQLKSFILEPKAFFSDETEVYFIREDLPEGDFGRILENQDDFQFSWIKCTPNEKNEIPRNARYGSKIWVFHFFMPKKAKNFTELQEFFKVEGIDCENAIDNWKKINEKMKKLKLRNNISNVICSHGPAERVIIWNIHSNKFFCKLCCINTYRAFNKGGQIGYQFLTGDAEIDDQERFSKEFHDELIKSILFQVPHHGSKENWHDWFCACQPYCVFWPVTHNANHKYKGRGAFPSAAFSFVTPYSITEVKSTMLEVQIYFTKT